jgi:cytochrome c biogenesis protein CcmG/thiol:disulfide interchange protein DsbE
MSVTDDAAVQPVRSRHTARNAAVVVGVVLLALIVLLATRGADEETSSKIVGQAAPDFTGQTLDDDTFRLSQHRGEWVLVNFFASWCVPCRIEHPELVRYAEEHADDGVQVVSVAFSDESEDIRQFFVEEGGDWPVLPSQTGSIALDYGVSQVPETYVVAPSGLVVARIDDGFTVAKMDAIIDSLGGLEATTETGS